MELLLCTNGSKDSQIALRLGAQLALTLGLPTTVLGIVESSVRQREVAAKVTKMLEQMRAAGITVESRIVAGDAQTIIPCEANLGNYLTVFGALNPPLWRRLLRGPTMRHVLDAIEGPALCVYESYEPSTIENVLICSGGLQHAMAAVELGGQIAAAYKARVTLLHVATLHTNLPNHFQDIPHSPAEYLQDETLYAENLQQAIDALEEKGLTVTFCIRVGDPLREILKAIGDERYDLVVIGSHSVVTGPAQLVGDITYRIVERAGRPVLVAKN